MFRVKNLHHSQEISPQSFRNFVRYSPYSASARNRNNKPHKTLLSEKPSIEAPAKAVASGKSSAIQHTPQPMMPAISSLIGFFVFIYCS